MRLPTPHSKRLTSAAAVACAGLLAAAVTLAVTAFPAAAAGTPACTASGLVVWWDTSGSGTAGATYYGLQITNVSGHTCTLTGYPGVSAVDLGGHQLGSAAIHNTVSKTATITLSSGTTASAQNTTAVALVKITDVANYPAATCKPVTAAGLRVYAPGQKSSTVIPYPFRACSKSGPTYLSVETVERGIAPSTSA
jgi:hypothetical protein